MITKSEKRKQRLKDLKVLEIAKKNTYSGRSMRSPNRKTIVFAKEKNIEHYLSQGYTFTVNKKM